MSIFLSRFPIDRSTGNSVKGACRRILAESYSSLETRQRGSTSLRTLCSSALSLIADHPNLQRTDDELKQ